MTPYYQDDLVTLYLGDCREVLPTLRPTMKPSSTDPPYGTGRPASNRTRTLASGIDVLRTGAHRSETARRRRSSPHFQP